MLNEPDVGMTGLPESPGAEKAIPCRDEQPIAAWVSRNFSIQLQPLRPHLSSRFSDFCESRYLQENMCPVPSSSFWERACFYPNELLAELVEESIKMLTTSLIESKSRKSQEQCGIDEGSVHKPLESLICRCPPETSVGIPRLRCRLDPQDDLLDCRATP